MKKSLRLLFLPLLGVSTLTGTTAKAVDLAQIVIADTSQARQVAEIVGRALARHDNAFIVMVSSSQLEDLRNHGLTAEIVMTDIDPEQLYFVVAPAPFQATKVIEAGEFDRQVQLDQNRRIVQLDRIMADSLAHILRIGALPSCRPDIPIMFVRASITMPLRAPVPADTLASLVRQDSLFSYNKRLEDFYTRFIFTDSIDHARDWLVSTFQGFGYSNVSLQPFWHTSWAGTGYGYNVIAVKPGYAEPEHVILIGAHYDSYTRIAPELVAPGADDNGSGVALMLEVARILADQPLRKTVMFVAFSAEEQWMYGSEYTAQKILSDGTKLEVMFDYDMVGYTAGPYWKISVHSEICDAYRAATSEAATRIAQLYPFNPGMSLPGDNYPFEDLGYPTVRVEEGEFNDPNYHQESDLCSNMNFPYLTEVTKMAIVSLALVADAAYPVAVDEVVDVGDGQSLEVGWSDCSPDCEYMLYWGVESGHYTDSLAVPLGSCSWTMTGLPEGDSCYFLVMGESPGGYRAFYGTEGTGLPLLYPRVPGGLTGSAVAMQLRLDLSWRSNHEGDFSHYNVYRRIGTVGAWSLYEAGVTDTTFADVGVVGHVSYEYAVTAVDLDGHESGLSEGVLLYPATFDGGLVIGDAFVKDHATDPDQAEQEAWLDTVLGGMGFGVAYSDENGGPITLSDVGPYSTLLWIDDDVVVKNIGLSEGALNGFASYGDNMLISGYRTWFYWSPKSVSPAHLLYREFGLSYYDYSSSFDFIGAFGQNGWPSVQIDPARGVDQRKDIPKLTPRAGAQVILTFDSYTDMAGWEGEPVGMTYETAHGKRVLLSFPLYYLTPASAQALLAKVMEYFGYSSEFAKGDLDHSGTIDILDVMILLDHLFISMRPLAYPELADMDAHPGVSIGDVFVLIFYLFLDGPAPVASP